MFIGIVTILIYLLMAVLIYRKTISALLALPLMAVALSIVGGVPASDIVNEIIGKGSLKLSTAYTTTMFGSILADLLNRLGIAKSIVKVVAEFAGDNRFFLALVLTLLTALLFSTLGGLGAVIMVGTIILPVLLSLGVTNQTAGALFLFGISLGGMFNIVGWQLYMDVLNIPKEEIINFVSNFAFILLSLIVVFLAVELKGKKNIFYALGCFVFIVLGFFSANYLRHSFLIVAANSQTNSAILNTSIMAFSVLLCFLILHAFLRSRYSKTNLPFIVYFTPLVPLVLVLFFQWPFITAFLAGIVYAVLGSWRTDSVKTLNQSIIEGITTVIPVVILMIGIGMLITAVQHPSFAQSITPLLQNSIPKTKLQYIFTFTILAPLALYRGPLSIWGMGSGLVSLLQKAAILSGSAIMGTLMSVGQIQGICDPTNTHNIWIASYLGTNTQVLLRKTLPYAWIAVIFGLTLVASLGYLNR
jgi:hypothetical protein